MKARDTLAVVALAVGGVAIAATMGWLRGGSGRIVTESVVLPKAGLVLAAGSANLGRSLASDASPFWAAALAPAARAGRIDDNGPGVLGLYRRGWTIVTARPLAPGGPAASRYGPFHVTASAPDRLPRAGMPEIAVPLPQTGLAMIWTRPVDAASAGAAAWGRALPSRADGIVDALAGRESWRLTCATPCLLDALRPTAGTGSELALGDELPPEPAAVAEASFDPARLEAALDLAVIADVERFLGFPLRRELARALAGHAAVALVDEPVGAAPGSVLAVFDLARPDVARSLVERTLALGVLSGEVGVERYRDVTVGAWTRPGGGFDLHPAVAVDGDVLLVATRKGDLLAALDRRRRPRRPAPTWRTELDRAGPGPWRGWSRSSFLCNGWFELLTGRPAQSPIPAGDVASRLVRRGDAWVLESRGPGPAFAADPILPAVRSLVRAARGAR